MFLPLPYKKGFSRAFYAAACFFILVIFFLGAFSQFQVNDMYSFLVFHLVAIGFAIAIDDLIFLKFPNSMRLLSWALLLLFGICFFLNFSISPEFVDRARITTSGFSLTIVATLLLLVVTFNFGEKGSAMVPLLLIAFLAVPYTFLLSRQNWAQHRLWSRSNDKYHLVFDVIDPQHLIESDVFVYIDSFKGDPNIRLEDIQVGLSTRVFPCSNVIAFADAKGIVAAAAVGGDARKVITDNQRVADSIAASGQMWKALEGHYPLAGFFYLVRSIPVN